jgi:DNA uptake protein ComE-like DNA-binding protein
LISAVTQAKRVLKYRDERGFSSLDALDEIPGLPQSYLNELKEKLTL